MSWAYFLKLFWFHVSLSHIGPTLKFQAIRSAQVMEEQNSLNTYKHSFWCIGVNNSFCSQNKNTCFCLLFIVSFILLESQKKDNKKKENEWKKKRFTK